MSPLAFHCRFHCQWAVQIRMHIAALRDKRCWQLWSLDVRLHRGVCPNHYYSSQYFLEWVEYVLRNAFLHIMHGIVLDRWDSYIYTQSSWLHCAVVIGDMASLSTYCDTPAAKATCTWTLPGRSIEGLENVGLEFVFHQFLFHITAKSWLASCNWEW